MQLLLQFLQTLRIYRRHSGAIGKLRETLLESELLQAQLFILPFKLLHNPVLEEIDWVIRITLILFESVCC
jgi:hypothetical protein